MSRADGDCLPGLGVNDMKSSYLEVTFRQGRPLAAYLYLPRKPADKSHRTEKVEPGLIRIIIVIGSEPEHG